MDTGTSPVISPSIQKGVINIMDKSNVPDVKQFGYFIRIKSIDFFGVFTISQNGKYILAWRDSSPSDGIGGARDKGMGAYVLLENNNVVLIGEMERPNDGHVTDNGTFVLNDWMFGGELQGTFYAIDRQGNLLIKKVLKANLYNNGISSDGDFAVCQTCNSDTPDGSNLYFFDLPKGVMLWSKPPERGWASSYEFDSNKRLLYLIYGEAEKSLYAFSGEFLGNEK